jgi:hypothetical protein
MMALFAALQPPSRRSFTAVVKYSSCAVSRFNFLDRNGGVQHWQTLQDILRQALAEIGLCSYPANI